jgi:acyl dehydratase
VPNLLARVRPLLREGEVTEVTPSRSRPQGTVKVKWTAFNQNGTAVYTFSPIGIVPRRPSA